MKKFQKSEISKFSHSKYLPNAIIAGVILLVYIQNLWFHYIYLDDNLILSIQVDKINSITSLLGAFKRGYLFDTYYRPIVMVSFIIDTLIAGKSSLMMYHLTNLILHILVSLLFYNLLLKLKTGDKVSLILSVLYAIHPMHVNAVSWIVGRNDLLLALFGLLSFLAFIKFSITKSKRFLILSLISYFFAMLTKESGILIPIIFIIYTFFFDDKNKVELKNYFLFIIYIYPVIIYIFLRLYVADIILRDGIGIKSFFENIYIFFEYIGKIFYFPAIEPLPIKNDLLVVLGCALLLIIILSGIKFIKYKYDKKLFYFGIISFTLLILPSLLVKIVLSEGNTYYLDSRSYFPLVGIFISFGSIFSSIKTTKTLLITLLTIWAIYSISFVYIKNQAYKNGKVFWETVTELHPYQADYWLGFGSYYFNMGNFEKAAVCGKKAINLNPLVTEYYEKTARASIESGNDDLAIDILNKGIKQNINKPKLLLQLIQLYDKIGDDKNSERVLNELESISNKKISLSYLYLAAKYYKSSGNFNKALKIMSKVIECDSTNAIYINSVGILYRELGRFDEANRCFFKAFQLKPTNPEYLKNLGQIR